VAKARLLLLGCLALSLGLLWLSWSYQVPLMVDGIGLILFKGGIDVVFAPDSGVIDQWLIEEGDKVKAGQVLALMANQREIKAHKAGVIAEIISFAANNVEAGQSLAFISADGDPKKDLHLVAFVSSLEGKKISAGMKVHIRPTISDSRHGYLVGTVSRLGKLPISKAGITSLVKIPELAKYIRSQISAEPFLVMISLDHDSEHLTGYRWTKAGPNFLLDSGIIAHLSIIYEYVSPINFFVLGFK